MWLKRLHREGRFNYVSESLTETVAVEDEIESHEKRSADMSLMEKALAKIGEPCKSILEAFYIQKIEMPENTPVSMNFWGFDPGVFEFIQKIFLKFLQENENNLKSEFFIPILGDTFIQQEANNIKVIRTSAQWFGVTYQEDAPEVKASIEKLVATGEYPQQLWEEGE